MECKNMQIVGTQKAGNRRLVPCGKCIACRVNATSMWTLRLMYEREYWSKSSFLTLDYNDENLPHSDSQYFQGTLCPSHSTNFWKLLRRDIDTPIKYYLCGEYGEKSHRSHMHAIIFGLDNSQETKELIWSNWQKNDYVHFMREKTLGTAEHDSMQYVTGYVQKKLYDDMKFYEREDVVPPFSRQSQGLGLRYFLDNQKYLFDQGLLDFKGRELPVPKYYRDKYPDMPIIQKNAMDYLIYRNEKLIQKYGAETWQNMADNHMLLLWQTSDFNECQTIIRNREKRFGGTNGTL